MTSPESQSRYRLSEGLIDRRVGDDLVVHRFETDDVFVLNGHARIVFEAAGVGGTQADIRRYVIENGFTDEESIAAADATVQEMVREGLVLVEEYPTANEDG